MPMMQRGPIKGLDAAAQMRYTHTKGGVGILIENGFPLYLLPPSQHNTKKGKYLVLTKRFLASGWRAPRVHQYA
jgi:hypothetical protein